MRGVRMTEEVVLAGIFKHMYGVKYDPADPDHEGMMEAPRKVLEEMQAGPARSPACEPK